MKRNNIIYKLAKKSYPRIDSLRSVKTFDLYVNAILGLCDYLLVSILIMLWFALTIGIGAIGVLIILDDSVPGSIVFGSIVCIFSFVLTSIGIHGLYSIYGSSFKFNKHFTYFDQ